MLGGLIMKFFKQGSFFKVFCCLLTTVLINNSIPAKASSVQANDSNTSSNSSTDFTWPTGPSVYADAAIVMEASTGLILYEKDIYDKHYPASITKIMTTLLAVENNNLNETVTMSHEAEWDVDFNSSRIGLVEGEQLSLEDALYGVMLESANEVSYAVGEHVANGPITDFAKMMNERAKELGSVNTNFVNPHGLHDANHYTCAYDMALISRAAINNPEFKKITGTRTHTIPATNKNVSRPLANHHRFIRKTINYEGAIGGKTGGTTEAKTTLVTFAERNGLTLIAVVLHVDTSLHAYEDTAKILDFAFDNYSLYNIEQTELSGDASFPDLFSSVPFLKKEEKSLIRIADNSNIVLPVSANIADAKKTITLTPIEELSHGDNVIGKISYEFAGKFVGFADILYYNTDHPITKEVIEEKWPSYLISPEDVIASRADKENSNDEAKEVINTPDQKITEIESLNTKTSKIKPILIGVFAGAIVLIIGWYILFIEFPHRKRRRTYLANRKKRMAALKYLNKDNHLDF